MWKKIAIGARETVGYFIGELKLIFSDSGAVLFFMLAMFIYPMLYIAGYYNEVVRDVPVAIVDLDHSSLSRTYSRMIDASEQVSVTIKPQSVSEAKQLFFEGKVKGVILIPNNFEKDIITTKQTIVTVYSDASFFLLYKQVYSGVNYAHGTFAAGVEMKRSLTEGKSLATALEQQEPVKLDVYNLYNPSGGYASFILPGAILIIMQQTLLIGIGVLGGTIREKKIFLKMNGKARHHLGSVRLVLGKTSAYFLVYLFNALFTFVIFHHWFVLPDKANMSLVFTLFVPFILSISFLGLAVSMIFKERVHAILFLVFLSPIMLFICGISWPQSALPYPIYVFSYIFPSTLAVSAYLKLRTCGAGFDAVRFEFLFLIGQTVLYFIIAMLSYRYSIRIFGKRIGKI